jgi:hypothetical protein
MSEEKRVEILNKEVLKQDLRLPLDTNIDILKDYNIDKNKNEK